MTVVSAGTRLGPYEVVSRLGAGGMGEVWKARDTRLDRRVAIKILPAELAQDPQFKSRFEREAKTISQLNHPHICTLYDVGDDFLVMELLEGETLADRLERGPLSLSEVLKYGAQIAEALDRAHRGGVVHRDLKPGNVMITRAGAKLLDFGLAKVTELEAFDDVTVQKPLTQQGTILGTFQYMAPEQLEAAEADARTDIFALGALCTRCPLASEPSLQRRRRRSLRRSSRTSRGRCPRSNPSRLQRSSTSSPSAWQRIPRTAGKVHATWRRSFDGSAREAPRSACPRRWKQRSCPPSALRGAPPRSPA